MMARLSKLFDGVINVYTEKRKGDIAPSCPTLDVKSYSIVPNNSILSLLWNDSGGSNR